MTNSSNNNSVHNEIPPPLGFDEFQTLSSTKQNIELFKILSAIAEEIEVLRRSTEQRFQALESLVQPNKANIYGLLPTSVVQANGSKSRSDCSSQFRKNSDDLVESSSIPGAGGIANGNGSGNTTRPASWPKDPNRQESRDVEFLLARNAVEDRPVLLNVGGKKFEVSHGIHFNFLCFIETCVFQRTSKISDF